MASAARFGLIHVHGQLHNGPHLTRAKNTPHYQLKEISSLKQKETHLHMSLFVNDVTKLAQVKDLLPQQMQDLSAPNLDMLISSHSHVSDEHICEFIDYQKQQDIDKEMPEGVICMLACMNQRLYKGTIEGSNQRGELPEGTYVTLMKIREAMSVSEDFGDELDDIPHLH
ncbi:hypothetical protein ACJX0J_041378, partial [Zea mays]